MPWNDNSGNRGSNNQGPWGQGPRGPQNGGNQPPDLEELLRQGQQRLKNAFPGGGGRGGGPGISGGGAAAIGLIVLVLWAFTGVYQVEQDELGVVTRFGKFTAMTPPGLNYHLPFPIESVQTPKVTVVNRETIGFAESSRNGRSQGNSNESLMLTGDENIVDIEFEVQWQIDLRPAAEGQMPGPAKFLFAIENPQAAVKAVAEASMREVIGQKNLEPIITTARAEVQDKVLELMQTALDSYDAGVVITQVNIQKADPPSAVIEAFNDVVQAGQDQQRAINQANAYRNDVVPRARGQAQQFIEQASAYQERVVNLAEGEAFRFNAILEEYRKAPDVTRQRLFLETMQGVLQDTNKVIIDGDSGGVVPYLPLPELQKRTNN